MGQRIKLRRDTTGGWATSNTILADGEQGYDSSLRLFKMGDGVTPWGGLKYFNELAINQGVTISLGFPSTINTGLNAIPNDVSAFLVCKVASNGYAVNEIVTPSLSNYSVSATSAGGSIAFGTAAPQVIPRLGGAPVAITPANWMVKVVFKR